MIMSGKMRLIYTREPPLIIKIKALIHVMCRELRRSAQLTHFSEICFQSAYPLSIKTNIHAGVTRYVLIMSSVDLHRSALKLNRILHNLI